MTNHSHCVCACIKADVYLHDYTLYSLGKPNSFFLFFMWTLDNIWHLIAHSLCSKYWFELFLMLQSWGRWCSWVDLQRLGSLFFSFCFVSFPFFPDISKHNSCALSSFFLLARIRLSVLLSVARATTQWCKHGHVSGGRSGNKESIPLKRKH